MKIKKKKLNNNLLIKLKLAEIRVKNFYLNFNNLTDFSARLKRAFKIIYKYHINKKKIMFIGISEKVNENFKKLLKKTKHVFLPDSFWKYGILTNPSNSLYNLKKKIKLLPLGFLQKIKDLKKISLVVMLESFYKKSIANECYRIRLPIIFLNNKSLNLNFNKSYSLSSNYTFSKKKIGDSFFYLMLFALFKKREIFMSLNKK